MRKPTLFFIGVFVVAALGLLFFWYTRSSAPSVAVSFGDSQTSPVPAATAPFVRDVPAGYSEYHNTTYHFSVIYPDNLSASEHTSPSGAAFSFEDDKNIVGFQVYVQPFSGSQISEQQFKQDIPSGVRTDLKDIKIDGAVGAAFYSTDHLLGATREMWFIRNGLLYEVTTFKESDTWLDSIMQTWKFF